MVPRHMQLKQTKVLARGGFGRAAEESREVFDVTDVILLDLLREMTRRHVFDHAPAQRADGRVGHGDSFCLTRGSNPMIFRQDEPSRYPDIQCASRTLSPGHLPRVKLNESYCPISGHLGCQCSSNDPA